MIDLTLIIGLIGLSCLSLSGVPQLLKAVKEGHANGVAFGTIWLWLVGEFAYIIYALCVQADWLILLNYVFNFSIVAVLAYYKHFPKRRPKVYEMCEASSTLVVGSEVLGKLRYRSIGSPDSLNL